MGQLWFVVAAVVVVVVSSSCSIFSEARSFPAAGQYKFSKFTRTTTGINSQDVEQTPRPDDQQTHPPEFTTNGGYRYHGLDPKKTPPISTTTTSFQNNPTSYKSYPEQYAATHYPPTATNPHDQNEDEFEDEAEDDLDDLDDLDEDSTLSDQNNKYYQHYEEEKEFEAHETTRVGGNPFPTNTQYTNQNPFSGNQVFDMNDLQDKQQQTTENTEDEFEQFP